METGMSDQSRVDGKKSADRRELTAAERQAVRRFKKRAKANPAIRFKLTDGERSFNLELDHSQKHICHPMLMKGLAATDKDFIEGIVDELINVDGMVNERSLNFMLSLINAIEPRDPLETMLAVQMATVHVAAMKLARDVVYVGHLEPAQCFAKLTRTFTAQMEALKRHRANEEKVKPQPRAQGEKPVMRKVTKPARARVPEQRAAASQPIAFETYKRRCP